MYPLSAAGIEAAATRIHDFIHLTPILTSSTLNDHFFSLLKNPGAEKPKIYFKCENFQKTGSFKVRGAANAVLKAQNDQVSGFVTHSSGNHGQALAFAAKKSGKDCVVVVPENAPKTKINAIAAYGAEITLVPPTLTARKSKCEEIAKERNYKIIDPHDDWEVMEGQGTIAIEMNKQIPNLDAVLIATGGGGLASGILQWFCERNSKVRVFLIEPEGKNISESVSAGNRLWTTTEPLDTIADGVRVRPLGEKCFQVIKNCNHQSNSDIESAWKLIWERLKIVVEPTAPMPLAALLKYADDFKDYKNIGVVICGGNVDFPNQ
uniref:Tryptophan synthase beta chain-like PALP domain-containing protein n=1 Tax=Panagrolaimus sp. JU765 TaxID=591449 RepID=A0AC34R406_9BILA